VPARFLVISACVWAAWFGLGTLTAGLLIARGTANPGWWAALLPAVLVLLWVYAVAIVGVQGKMRAVVARLRVMWIAMVSIMGIVFLSPAMIAAGRAWMAGESLRNGPQMEVLYYGTISAAIAIVFAIPPLIGVLVADVRVRRRVAASDPTWRPHLAWPQQRRAAATGLLITVGACAAPIGAAAVLLRSGVGLSNDEPWRAAASVLFAVLWGAAAGWLVGIPVGHQLRNSDLSRTLPRVAAWTLAASPVCATALPPVPASLCVVGVAFGAAVAARRRFPVFEPGTCVRCGYDLSGLPGELGPCPECGLGATLVVASR
jgi:hypothetical protein